ncbi:MAG: metal ABC transporter substrate-binding protein [Myxococcota bacterium]
MVTTTTMLRDLVEQLGGDAVAVQSLVGVGADPHTFQPKPGSARAVATSDLVVTSGLSLEGWIDDLIHNAGGERPVIVASEGVDPIRMEAFKAGVDPHFWFDTSLWAVAATNVASGLDRLFTTRPEAQKRIAQNLKRYLIELEKLNAWTRSQLETIPADQRVLVTSHDAFNYFGRAFGLEVVGIQGLSTESEASQRDVVRVIDLVKKRAVPAVFVESSVNRALIKRVASETGAAVRGPLFSDSLGDTEGPAGTYVGMVSENVRVITEGLNGRFQPLKGSIVADAP